MKLFQKIFRTKDKNVSKIDNWTPGTKVSLKNEFGVVLDKTVDSDLVGLIRWDTDKENDTEDWRGLFGTFLQSGGQVINQDYKFKFIEDNGQLKKASR